MTEYFIFANSFAAPFFSDQSTAYRKADDPVQALNDFAADYKHPCGLYAAVAYASADAYHKGAKALATWLCNHEREKRRLTEGLQGYSYYGHGPGEFEINRVKYTVENPHDGFATLEAA